MLAAVFYLRGGKEHVEPASEGPQAHAVPQLARSPTPETVLAIRPSGSTPKPAARPSPRISPLMQELWSAPRKPLYERLSQQANRTPEESYVLARILETCTDYPARPKDQRNPDEER